MSAARTVRKKLVQEAMRCIEYSWTSTLVTGSQSVDHAARARARNLATQAYQQKARPIQCDPVTLRHNPAKPQQGFPHHAHHLAKGNNCHLVKQTQSNCSPL